MSKVNKKCVHNLGGGRCRVCKDMECTNCSFVNEDPKDYLKQMVGIYLYSAARSGANLYQMKNEILHFCDLHGLDYPELPYRDSMYFGLEQVYNEEIHRGEKGGASESVPKTGKPSGDNRAKETKLNSKDRAAIKEATAEWEAKHGKLDKLGRSPLSRNRIDSYTGEAIK